MRVDVWVSVWAGGCYVLQGKDIFEAFFKKDLAKRLLLGMGGEERRGAIEGDERRQRCSYRRGAIQASSYTKGSRGVLPCTT